MKTQCGVFAIVASLLWAPFVSAQTAGTGALTGTVTDSSNSAIPGATVTATNTGNGQSRVTTTGESGSPIRGNVKRHFSPPACGGGCFRAFSPQPQATLTL